MKSTRSAENKIKSARLAAGMTQAEMSEKYGIPADTIKSWDRGKAYPPLWVETLLLDKLREESLVRKKLPRFPELDDIKNFSAFARAYIEIHGVLDSHIIKGYQNRRTRLRIYGNLDVLSLLNDVLPAKPKKIQEINTQTGTTYCLSYQSKAEVCEILDWIDGSPRNESVWERWNKTLDCK